MAEVTVENILAASAAEADEVMEDVQTTGVDGAQATGNAAVDATASVVVGGNSATVGSTGAATSAAASSATVKPATKPNAAAAAQPPRPFNLKWLQSAEKNRQHFSDELFNTIFTQENVEKVVEELKTLTSNRIANSLRLCEDDHTYSLQITTHGFLRVPTHLMRIELPYTVLANDSPVCLFVRDLKKPPQTPGRQAKSPNLADLTVRHYEQLLAAAKIDISNVTVIPLSVLFNDYISLDQRRKLTYLYDKFIVEASVATRVNAFLGVKLLYRFSRAAFPIDLRAADLAAEWDTVQRQVFYQSLQAADHEITRPHICVGRESQDTAQVAENIVDLLGQLGALQPGGAPNISSLYLRASGNVATTVQLYKDAATSAPEIPAPEVPAPVLLTNADGTVTVQPVEKLTDTVPNLTQHIIDNLHYIVYDVEDEYAEDLGVDPQQKPVYQKRGSIGGGVAGDGPKRRSVLQNPPQQQQQQHHNSTQQQHVTRASASGVRRVAATVATGQTSIVDQLVLRGLKELLAQPNIGNLMAGGGGQNYGGNNVRRMQQQQNVGNNGGYVARRSNNPQQQQRGGIVGRNQMAGGNVQRRRNVNQMNGSGVQRNNRRFI